MKSSIRKKAIHAPSNLNEPIQYGKSFSRGLRVTPGKGDFLLISGTASLDDKGKSCHRGNFRAQTERTFGNLTALLGSEKATWHDVVFTRCYLKSMRHYKQFNDFRNAFYKKHGLNPFPASVCVQATLCRPELLVEVELVAIVH